MAALWNQTVEFWHGQQGGGLTPFTDWIVLFFNRLNHQTMFIFDFLKRRWFDLTTWNAGVFLTGADMLSDQSNETRESCQFHHFLFGSQPGRKTNSNKPMEGGLTFRPLCEEIAVFNPITFCQSEM